MFFQELTDWQFIYVNAAHVRSSGWDGGKLQGVKRNNNDKLNGFKWNLQLFYRDYDSMDSKNVSNTTQYLMVVFIRVPDAYISPSVQMAQPACIFLMAYSPLVEKDPEEPKLTL